MSDYPCLRFGLVSSRKKTHVVVRSISSLALRVSVFACVVALLERPAAAWAGCGEGRETLAAVGARDEIGIRDRFAAGGEQCHGESDSRERAETSKADQQFPVADAEHGASCSWAGLRML